MEKRFYWLKLNQNFFNEDKIDVLLSQKGGANYVVLYQMLCLKSINNNGNLGTPFGDIIIPYDVDKIVRDCKYFSKDTVLVALELYKKLGLVFEEQNKVLKIANFENIVGSEVPSAHRVREHRARQKQALQCNKNVTLNVTERKRKEKELELELNNYNTNLGEKNNNAHARETQNFSPSQKTFQEIFPEKALNIAVEIESSLDIDKLVEAINESEFLKTANNLKFDWCVEHYAQIVAGDYKDFKKQDTAVLISRQYTEEEKKDLFTPIDEIEL